MLTLLLTCLFCLIAALAVWLFSRMTTQRTQALQALASDKGWRYCNRLAFSRELRLRHFHLLTAAASASARHCLISPGDTLWVMDITAMSRHQLTEQTVILVSCSLDLHGQISISRNRWLEYDQLTPMHDQPPVTLSQDDLPVRLAQWHCRSDTRHRMRGFFREGVIDWLETHPELHVEWSQGWLLVCQPGCQVVPENLERAIKDVQQLAGLLQSCPTNRGKHHEQAE